MLSIPAPGSPPYINVDLELEEKRSSHVSTTSRSTSAVPLSPFELYQLLEQDEDVMVVDTRNLEAFLGEQGRIRNSM
jgi:3-mercaptopyruvate sulfurtransferase SseA